MSETLTVPMPPPAAAEVEPAQLSWVKPHGMVGLSLVNFLLRIVTLGVYHFWGKTEVRRRIWSAIRLNGDPLAYTGTGRELMLGFLTVFAAVILPTLILSLVMALLLGPESRLMPLLNLLVYAGFFYLTGVAIHRAQRYRLARTRWRGIRGGMEGDAWRFAWTYFWTGLLIPLTLGWIMPWRATKLQGLLTNDMRFGDRPFHFAAPSGPLYPRFVGLWVGSAVILGLIGITITGLMSRLGIDPETFQPGAGADPSKIMVLVGTVYALLFIGLLLYAILSAWYRAGLMNHFAAHTTFEGARFRANATAPSLIWLALSNFLILSTGVLLAGVVVGLVAVALASAVATLDPAGGPATQVLTALMPLLFMIMLLAGFGLWLPVTQARSARYFVERLALDGNLPVAAIAQAAEDKIRRGEGLAQAFDVDAF